MKKEDYIDTFTHNVKYLRIKSRYSVGKMAEILKVRHDDIVKIEKGILPKNIRADILFILCKYFEISIETITEVKLR